MKKKKCSGVDKIEAQSIETNAIDYMFKKANHNLTNDALTLLRNIYEKVV